MSLTELFHTETDGEEMTTGEASEEMYAKSMRWMEDMFPGVPKEQMERSDGVARETTVDAPADDAVGEPAEVMQTSRTRASSLKI